ncbi:5-oxoprolinase (ATP-hydrolyzing)/N-methylhydantoinase B [Rhodoligotrophos appendicifer]|uniref:hydantoinase B/oxoprolinase family protein n=1 Tax=Rhodoligotrophos appendicifer TaxID=987056 RepID=UPI0011868816|nr:hydantoinase B/oxoprolinase family protein [Rhodoligotrophos appendicifer]
MKFSANKLYIEKYVKCANCGVLIYGPSIAARDGSGDVFCSDWCVDWKAARAASDAEPRLPLPREAREPSLQGRDMVAMKILEGNLVSICRDMGITLMKTAYSTIFSESLDFTCGLFAANGDMIAVGEFCPSMISGMPMIIKTVIQEIEPGEMEEGDILLHNDPYRGGMHTPEHLFFKPIFFEGELVGFSGAIGHVAEIGGVAPGSFYAEARDIFAEGLRVPPVKIKRRGEDNIDVWKILLANVRTPRTNHGDYRALIAAVDLGERRTIELLQKYGKEHFTQITSSLMDYAEERMRAEISDIPDGHYSFQDFMEDDGLVDQELRIHVDLFVQGDEIVADFSKSSPQAKGPINTPLSIPTAATQNAILQLTDGSIPKNSGCFRPIKIIAPPGSLLNVNYPAPEVGGNTECHPRIAYTVLGALATCLPGRVPAADGSTWSNFLFGGTDPRTGEYYCCYDVHIVGWGGSASGDGNSAVGSINGNCPMVPIEVYETRFPWIVEEYSLVPDSGGAGQFRGGLGVRKVVRCDADEITFSHMGDRHKRGSWGLNDGEEGQPGSFLFEEAGTQGWKPVTQVFNKVSSSKFANLTAHRGDRIQITTPGGGGYGLPSDRETASTAEDFSEGFVSRP